MIRTNIPAASLPASQLTGRTVLAAPSEEDMLRCIDQGMQRHRGGCARRPLEHLAVSKSRDGRQNHVAPVGQRLRPLLRWAQPKMNEATASTAVVDPNFCMSQFWMSERNRISSGSAVATKMMPNVLAIPKAERFRGM